MKKLISNRIAVCLLLAAMGVVVIVLALPTQPVGVLKSRKAQKQITRKARAEYFHRMLRNPVTKEIPGNIRLRELRHAAGMPRKTDGLGKKQAAPQFSWFEAGPMDVDGRTRGLAVDINDPNTIISGGASGGIWKSTDRGETWTLKSDPAIAPGITFLTQDPRPGNTDTWYATTGKFSGSNSDRGFRAFYYGQGMLQSTDNGETWRLITLAGTNPFTFDSPFDYLSKVQVHPVTGTVFLASNGYGLNRIAGALTNPTSVLGDEIFPSWTDFDIASNGTIVAVISDGFVEDLSGEQPGVYRSIDDGLTWTDITPQGFPNAPDRSVIAVAPSNPDVAYMLTFTGTIFSANNAFDEVEQMQLYKLNLGSGTSQNLTANLPDFGGQVGDLYSQQGYNMVIAVKPDDENHVFIGGTNLYVSRDGFATEPTNINLTWVGGYATANNISTYANHHPDQHALFFDPSNPNTLWSGHDGGISLVADVSATGPYRWQAKNNGYNTTQYYHVALPPAGTDNRLLGGTQDNGSPFFRFDPTSLSTSISSDVSFGDGAYAYLGESYAIASTQNGEMSAFSFSQDGELQFISEITPNNAVDQLFVNPFAVDPFDESIIYYPGGRGIWRRATGSVSNNSWSQINSLRLDTEYGYTALATGISNGATVLYLGASGTDVTPQVYRFENASTATTRASDISIPGVPADAYIHSIAVNPENSDEVLVGLSNYEITGLYHTNNAGANWSPVEGNLTGNLTNPGPSIRSVAIIPLPGKTVYMTGTSTGVYSTLRMDGSSTLWEQEAANELGNVIVENIASRSSDGRVALATHGRGIFIGTPGATDQPGNFSLTQNFPNPFNAATTIAFNVDEASQVTLKIYDIAGREIAILLNDALREAGEHEVSFDANALSSGSYVYQLEVVSLASSERLFTDSKVMTVYR